jgi:hypothetical protein
MQNKKGEKRMSDLVSKIVTLREFMIANRVSKEVQHEGIEMLLAFYETHKQKTGSYGHLMGDDYSLAMRGRLDWAYGKTLDFLKSKGYLK